MMSLPGSRGARRAAVTAAALVALTAGGCAQASPDVVAYVGDQRITQAQLDEVLDGLRATLQEGQTVSTEAVVNAMIQGELASQIATAKGITVTDAERDAALKGSELESLLSQPGTRAIAYDVADTQVVPGKVGAENYLAAVQAERVELNPRFGRLDADQKVIVEGSTGSLSVEAGGESTP